MVRRILTEMFRFGLFDHAADRVADRDRAPRRAHARPAEQVAQEGSVLLKNAGGVLPLGAPATTVAVIGDDAGQ